MKKHTFKHKEFADAIFKRRTQNRDASLSLTDVAKVLGLSKATLSRLEGEKTPDLLSYSRVCEWLGCGMDKFIKK